MNYKEILNIFEKEGYELLDKEYKNNTQTLQYICKKHREKGVQEVTMNAFKRGKRCVYCKYEKGIYVNPLPEDIIKEETEKRGYVYVGMERNQKTKVKFICPLHKEYGEQLKLWNDIRAGKQVCSRCNGHKTLEDFQKLVHEKNPNINIIDTDFKYSSKQVLCQCKICGNIWSPYGYNLISENNTGCPKCGNKEVGKKKAITKDYVLEKFSLLNDNIVPLSIPTKSSEIVERLCKICNEKFYPTFTNLTKKTNPTGCPFCKMKSGERAIFNFLKSNNIRFEFQKKFKDCKMKRYLPFDFYLPDYNICIEYDGQLHFNNSTLKRKESDSLEKVKERDNFKTEYCKSHDINLIRIPYWEFKNIESILNDIFYNKLS